MVAFVNRCSLDSLRAVAIPPSLPASATDMALVIVVQYSGKISGRTAGIRRNDLAMELCVVGHTYRGEMFVESLESRRGDDAPVRLVEHIERQSVHRRDRTCQVHWSDGRRPVDRCSESRSVLSK